MDGEKDILKIPYYKVGVKRLSDEQLMSVFPNYEDFIERLIEIRAMSPDIKSFIKFFDDNHQSVLPYDNIFTIAGGRGSGKTSVLVTIRENIADCDKNKIHNDIVFPIIIPEVISRNCTMIGWITTILGTEVKKITEEIESLGFDRRKAFENDKQYNFFKNCTLNHENELQNTYDDVKKSVFSGGYDEISSQYMFTEGTEILSDQSASNYNLIKNFSKLINIIIDLKTRLGEKNAKPFIYIFIDDADLAPQMSIELLSIIPKFLSHPNIIVLLSTSPKLLELVLESKIFHNIYNMPLNIIELEKSEQFKIDSTEKTSAYIRRISKQLIDKAFPPSNKFKLKNYTTLVKKTSFIYHPKCSEETRDKEEGLNLADFLKNGVDKLIKLKGSGHINFLQNKASKFDNIYLCFFGKSSREITNVCLSFEILIDELLNVEKSYDEVFYKKIHIALLNFLSIVLDVNTDLKKFATNSSSLILLDYKDFKLYVNYNEIINALYNLRNRSESKEYSDLSFIRLFVLMFFIENIIICVERDRINAHGQQEINLILNLLNNGNFQKLIFNELETKDILFQLGLYFDNYDIFKYFDCKEIVYQEMLIHMVFSNNIADMNCKDDDFLKLIKAYKFDQNWTKEFVKVLYLRNSGLWVFDRIDKNELFLYPNLDFVDDILFDTSDFTNDVIYSIINNTNEYDKETENYLKTYRKKMDIKNDSVFMNEFYHRYELFKRTMIEEMKTNVSFIERQIFILNDISILFNKNYIKEFVTEKIKSSYLKIQLSIIPDDAICEIYDNAKSNINLFLAKSTLEITDATLLHDTLEKLNSINKSSLNSVNSFKMSMKSLEQYSTISVLKFDSFVSAIKNQLKRISSLSQENLLYYGFETYYTALNDLYKCFKIIVKNNIPNVEMAFEYLISLKIIEELHEFNVYVCIKEELDKDRIHSAKNIEDAKKYYSSLCKKAKSSKDSDLINEIFYNATSEEKMNKYLELFGG